MMMMTVASYIRRGQHILRRASLNPRVHQIARCVKWLLTGCCLSAASLRHIPLPLAMAMALSTDRWESLLVSLGGTGGYLLFWGAEGLQGAAWMGLGLLGALVLSQSRLVQQQPLLLPAVGGMIVALVGLAFQLWGFRDLHLTLYLMRILLACGAVWVFTDAREHRDPVTGWLVSMIWVLALAQIEPLPWLGLGFVAAGALCAAGAFPAAALGGLALDLSHVTPVPMTAVLSLAYLLRLSPWANPWVVRLAPAMVHLLVCSLTGTWDLTPLPALLLGGVLSRFLPEQRKAVRRRGQVGVAQVRLELAAGVLAESERLLLEAQDPPIDEASLMRRCAERACGSCPCRKSCRDRDAVANMDPQLLHRTLLSPQDLSVSCRKNGRVLYELHRSQEQLRSLRANRERQSECRAAVIQQYQFLSRYLQDLSDTLGRRENPAANIYSVRVRVFANRPAADNGDRCLWFPGPGGQYFVLLCDGMGTGLGAVDEGRTAARMLKDLLCAGFPPEYALQSLNSLCALRGRAGAVTVDLGRIRLDTGRMTLYKWGAAPSFLLTDTGAEKIGTAGPPPGLSVHDTREAVARLSLDRGQTLMLLSDGVGGEDILRRWEPAKEAGPGELAARLLEGNKGTDDATVALITLCST